MGVLIGGLSFKEAIIHYYLFQKKLLDYFYKKIKEKMKIYYRMFT